MRRPQMDRDSAAHLLVHQPTASKPGCFWLSAQSNFQFRCYSTPIIDSVLSKQIDDLEPTLMRHGYSVKVLSEMLGTKPAEVRALFRQTLEPDRARELKEQLLAAGLPV